MNYTIYDSIEQGSEEWMRIRAGVITGTRLKSVIREIGVKGDETQRSKDKRLGLVYELIGEILTPPRETYVSGAMERGHLVEEVIKEIYHEPIRSVGFVKSDSTKWLGISPDGIIGDGEIKRAIEIKSPEAKTTIRYWIEDKIPDEYLWQIVHYFIVIDTLESLDFIVANPDMGDEFFRIKKKTVTREELKEYIEQAKEDLATFYELWTDTTNAFISLKNKIG